MAELENIDKPTSWDKLVDILKNLPMTWYPEAIRTICEAAYEKKVFRPGMVSRFIRRHCEEP
jgi:hypothetical protein